MAIAQPGTKRWRLNRRVPGTKAYRMSQMPRPGLHVGAQQAQMGSKRPTPVGGELRVVRPPGSPVVRPPKTPLMPNRNPGGVTTTGLVRPPKAPNSTVVRPGYTGELKGTKPAPEGPRRLLKNWQPGDRMPGGVSFVRYIRDPNRPGRFVPLVKTPQGTQIHPGFRGGKTPGWSNWTRDPLPPRPGSKPPVKSPAPSPAAPAAGIYSGAWTPQSQAYDLSKGTLRGVVRDFTSSTGWSIVDEYGRRRTVTSARDAVNAGWKLITKDQILRVNPGFYSVASAGGGTTPAPATPAPEQTPSWISMLFPQIGQAGATTNPSTPTPMSWSQLLRGAPSAVDSTFLSDQSNAIMQAQQGMLQPNTQWQSLTAVDPATGMTMYQAQMAAARRLMGQQSSSALGSAAARGVSSSGMTNQNLAALGTQYGAQATQIAAEVGDPALAQIQAQAQSQMQALQMSLYNAYQSSLSRAYGGLPQIGA